VASPDLLTAVATRPYPGETVSGDAWQLDGEEGRYRLTLVDGLGHGPEAALAAQRATSTLAAQPALGPTDSVQACHRALAGTRGAAIAVVCLDLPAAELRFAGIGNVEAQLWQGGHVERLIAYRGIVGAVMRTVREFVLPLEADWVLVMHTDGIRGRFDLPALPAFQRRNMADLAAAILADWSRLQDDATVVAVRPAPRPAGDDVPVEVPL
jgi:serine phosphatase RsbU (regulator of sigma subunit)